MMWHHAYMSILIVIIARANHLPRKNFWMEKSVVKWMHHPKLQLYSENISLVWVKLIKVPAVSAKQHFERIDISLQLQCHNGHGAKDIFD